MYRAYLQLLRLLPDPHLWAMSYPEMRRLCAYKPPPESILPREPDNFGTVQEIEERYVIWRQQVRNHAEAELLREKQLLETRGVSGGIYTAQEIRDTMLIVLWFVADPEPVSCGGGMSSPCSAQNDPKSLWAERRTKAKLAQGELEHFFLLTQSFI